MPDLIHLSTSKCPHCGYTIDTVAWHDAGHRPDVGDLTICQGCARVLRFGRHLRVSAMTDRDERVFLASNPDIKAQCVVVARRLLAALPSPLALHRRS